VRMLVISSVCRSKKILKMFLTMGPYSGCF
jgi:hypothetical protein